MRRAMNVRHLAYKIVMKLMNIYLLEGDWGAGESEVIASASDLEEPGEPGHVLPWGKSRI